MSGDYKDRYPFFYPDHASQNVHPVVATVDGGGQTHHQVPHERTVNPADLETPAARAAQRAAWHSFDPDASLPDPSSSATQHNKRDVTHIQCGLDEFAGRQLCNYTGPGFPIYKDWRSHMNDHGSRCSCGRVFIKSGTWNDHRRLNAPYGTCQAKPLTSEQEGREMTKRWELRLSPKQWDEWHKKKRGDWHQARIWWREQLREVTFSERDLTVAAPNNPNSTFYPSIHRGQLLNPELRAEYTDQQDFHDPVADVMGTIPSNYNVFSTSAAPYPPYTEAMDVDTPHAATEVIRPKEEQGDCTPTKPESISRDAGPSDILQTGLCPELMDQLRESFNALVSLLPSPAPTLTLAQIAILKTCSVHLNFFGSALEELDRHTSLTQAGQTGDPDLD